MQLFLIEISYFNIMDRYYLHALVSYLQWRRIDGDRAMPHSGSKRRRQSGGTPE